MNSPAVTPEQLAVAARALGGDELRPQDSPLGRREWWLIKAGKAEYIGSDADLCAAIRRALVAKYDRPILVRFYPSGGCELMIDRGVREPIGIAPDELSAHLAACIAAMCAKPHKIADHHPERHPYDPSRYLP
jgi:hypothetical protein